MHLFIHAYRISVLSTCTVQYCAQLHIYTVCVHIASTIVLLIVNPHVLYCSHDVYRTAVSVIDAAVKG